MNEDPNFGIAPASSEALLKYVTLIRDPHIRVGSGLLHRFHTCSSSPLSDDYFAEKIGTSYSNQSITNSQDADIICDANRTMLNRMTGKYAECVRGCTVNMLTGRRCDAGMPTPARTR